MTDLVETALNGAMVLEDVSRTYKHPHEYVCPRCGENTNVAITRLAYIFETCRCDVANYPHLVERLWHTECLIVAAADLVERELLESAADELERYRRPAPRSVAARIRAALGAPSINSTPPKEDS